MGAISYVVVYLASKQAKASDETLSGVYKFVLFVTNIWTCVCYISSACRAYIMRAELGHSHFSLGKPNVGRVTCQPFSNVATTGNGH